tara:strand:+ start:971 stop:1243 length:273 start_codon:yes stop_codon:yes gene_type:complete
MIHQMEKNVKISGASVGWHLDSFLKVINSVYDVLISSNTSNYKSKFIGLRLFTFTLGFFLRAKAKSPKRVLPLVLYFSLLNHIKITQNYL